MGDGEKSVFHETKEVVSRLREPYKFKLKSYRYETKDKLVVGHMIDVEVNLSGDKIDTMNQPNSEINQGILNCIKLIEGPLQSKYLGSTIQ